MLEHHCKEMEMMEITKWKQWEAPQVIEEEILTIQGVWRKCSAGDLQRFQIQVLKLGFNCLRDTISSSRHSQGRST